MCGIAGFCNFTENLRNNYVKNERIVNNMGKTLNHRGPDCFGTFVGEHIAFAHTRLAVIDVEGGKQPMRKMFAGYEYCIIYNGELYNTNDIKYKLQLKGYTFDTKSDTEVILTSYIENGVDCVNELNGIFAFAIWDGYNNSLFLARDRFGVKPLFYTTVGMKMIFASEIKSLFKYPNIEPIIDKYGICEIFGLGPAKTPGNGVYQGIHELPPGYLIYIDYNATRIYPYWRLKAKEHTDNYKQTVEKTRYLLFDSIKRQLVSDVPICTLLSGGLDSSIISSIASKVLSKENRTLDTYSFDYVDNNKYFKASSFQPSEDRPFVDIMNKYIKSNHRYLECDSEQLESCLYEAVLAKDLPGMADVDSSLLHFSKLIKQNHTVCLSGECADEIFGGYPWFRNEETYKLNAFPWSKNLDFRKSVISKELLLEIPIDEYVQIQYNKSIRRTPKLAGEDNIKQRQREIAYLNIVWFMQTLLDRKDRMTMASGLEVRVPFADHRLIEYVYNIPWEFKYRNQEVKGLLKDVAENILPNSILTRKKSPYPKSYNPMYENILKSKLNIILEDKNEPIHQLINIDYIKNLMSQNSDYGKPWFGQLMAVPQMYAYLLEINFWLKEYKVILKV